MTLAREAIRTSGLLATASQNACAAQVTLEEVLTPVEVIAEDRWSVSGTGSGTSWAWSAGVQGVDKGEDMECTLMF